MQMLYAGGHPILADDKRAPNEDNPRGYFEYQPVRATARDVSWVGDAQGKAVKVIYLLIEHLPRNYFYRVILMHRDLSEVVASQAAMLARKGAAAAATPERLASIYDSQMAGVKRLLRSAPCFEAIEVGFASCIAEPRNTAREVNRFLGGSLDEIAMSHAVDPSLYRNRIG